MRRTIAIAAALLAFGHAPAAADTFVPDPAHTTVRATWNHIGFSEQSLNFREVRGTVELDPADIASARVDMAVVIASIDTGVPALDAHLQTAEFFDSGRHAEARFVSTAVEKTGDMTARVTGDLTIRGITRPVVLDVTVNAVGEHPLVGFDARLSGTWIGITATATLLRSDWGMGLMVPAISDEVELFISAELQARPQG
jgi:polyisoprenoid-binding protein YceI